MKRSVVLLVTLLCAADVQPAPRNDPSSPASYTVEFEPMLVASDGVRSLQPSMMMRPLPLDDGGALHSMWRVGPEEKDLLVWRAEYRRDGESVDLTVGRTLRRGGVEKELPELRHRMPILDSWVTTLWDGPEGRLDLRIVILVGRAFVDEPLTEGKILMWIKGGLLILGAAPGSAEAKDEVVHVVNGGGMRGVSWGIPGLGVVKLAVDPFAGAVECGSVRGHRLTAKVGGRELLLVSEIPILPEDPGRPGYGWTLYGKLEPEKPGDVQSFHGGFDPSKER